MAYDDGPRDTVAWAIRTGRGDASLRAVARRSNISAGQISRIESGAVRQPAVETLTALAPAVNRHPAVLMILAGHLTGDSARVELKRLLVHSAGSFADAYEDGYSDELLARIEAAETDEELRWAAVEVATLPFASVDFPEALRVAMATDTPDSDLLEDLIRLWPGISPDRRWRLVELARDLHRVSLSTNATTT